MADNSCLEHSGTCRFRTGGTSQLAGRRSGTAGTVLLMRQETHDCRFEAEKAYCKKQDFCHWRSAWFYGRL